MSNRTHRTKSSVLPYTRTNY